MLHFYEPTEYQPKCNALYETYHRQLFLLIPHAKIEHIGSSVNPKSFSKGDLDIDVAVSQSEFEHSISQIKRLGFQEKLNTFRTPHLCMLESQNNDDVAIQWVVAGSEFESFILFRDRLRASVDLVEQYNLLKLNSVFLSMNQYREKKSQFIRYVLSL
ncbi:GrpB family protein [Acinetobacter lanii]|uniref:GrpB family protein n=1 Tax=Acinetobacter lanii TaxID=2715163 RepID=A0A6G8S3V1_9GAMM|nr:GrpB family protein [Acinetobacter lanii]QIO08653.1 GrpB family protein [Acinetobacter lanii]